MKHFKWLSLLIMLFTTLVAQAQNGLNSPFSQYGIGLSNIPYNVPIIAANGGVTYTRADNNMINPFNPASYAAVRSESFVLDMGLYLDMATLRDNNQSLFDVDGNLGYLNVAFPLTKWWKTALGIMPVSDVNYMTVTNSIVEHGGAVNTVFEGVGGVSEFFWGHGFNILGGTDPKKPQLRAGFNLDLLFGSDTSAVTFDFIANDTTYFMDSRRQKSATLRALTLDFGLQYDRPLSDNYRFSLGLNVKPGRKITLQESALVYTFVTNAGIEYMRDTIFPTDGNTDFESTLQQPFTTGIGFSFQRNDLWLVALDATFAPWSGFKYESGLVNPVFGQSALRYDNTQRYNLGVQLLGNPNASSYFRRITFSAGTHFESGRLSLQLADGREFRLNEWGVGIGVSLPMRKGRSVFNIAASYSSFGTTDLLRRDVFTIGISVGSCESWFVKRKFN